MALGTSYPLPFRQLQQSRQHTTDKVANMQSSARLRDTPMDFTYESPSRQRPSYASTWLDRTSHATASPSVVREAVDESQDKSSSSSAVPISPTIEGPDVEMASESSPVHRQSTSNRRAQANMLQSEKTRREEEDKENSGRHQGSYGVLTRIQRTKAPSASVKRSQAASRVRRKDSSSRLKRGMRAESRKTEEDDGDDADSDEGWLDDEEGEKKTKQRSASLRKRVGDTLNVRYYFNGASSPPSVGLRPDGHSTTSRRWLEPEWCLGMLQFGFNATLLLGIVWILFNVVLTLQRDVSSKVREYELEYLSEIEACSQSYHLNRCGTAGAVPALASACASWQRCSARDPANVGRARVAAETVAEIVNGFVDVVSWKSMLFTLLILIITVGATNSFLSFFRIRSRRSYDDDRRSSRGQQDDRRPLPSVPRRYDLRSSSGTPSNMHYSNMHGHPYPYEQHSWHSHPPS